MSVLSKVDWLILLQRQNYEWELDIRIKIAQGKKAVANKERLLKQIKELDLKKNF